MFVICYKGALTMEKQKKKISKKAVVICSIALAAVLIAGGVVGVIIHNNKRPVDPDKIYTFDEVTMGLADKVSYVVDSNNVMTQEEIDEIYKHCKEIYYHYSDINKTKRVSSGITMIEVPEQMSCLLFYDENNYKLFEIIHYRYGLYSIGINGEHIIYQIRHSMEENE